MSRRSSRNRSSIALVVVAALGLGIALATTPAIADPAQIALPPKPLCKSENSSACKTKCEWNRGSAGYDDSNVACDELGRMYRDGTPGVVGGVGAASPADAIKWFGLSCNFNGGYGWPPGCADLAAALLKSGDTSLEPKARAIYNAGCNQLTSACYLDASLHTLMGASVSHEACYGSGQMCESGRGGAKDFSTAMIAYQRACDGGDPRGCEGVKRVDPASKKERAPATPSAAPLPPKGGPTPPPTARAPAPRVR